MFAVSNSLTYLADFKLIGLYLAPLSDFTLPSSNLTFNDRIASIEIFSKIECSFFTYVETT